MRRLIRAYLSFTRTERMGLIVLCTVLVALVIVKATMPLWVHPHFDTQKEKELIAKWNEMDQRPGTADTEQPQPAKTVLSQSAPSGKSEKSNTLFYFDPNTLDSAGFRKLGLKEKTVSILLHWRAKGKHFYRKEDLKSLYTLTKQDYNRLAPYISIRPVAAVSLNKADSLTLVGLKGIGPKLAHRIIERRHTLGAFTSYDQLLELYHFPDSTFRELQQQLTLD